MIPYITVIIFALLGLWIINDEYPRIVLLNFPELIGRLLFVGFFLVVRTRWVIESHVHFMPIKSIIFYSDLIAEMNLMSEIPLGGELDD